MEECGYKEESYEEWKENDMRTELFAESTEELMEKKILLDILQEALDSLRPEEMELAVKVFGEEMELAVKVFGEEMPLIDFANMKKRNPRTLSDHKRRILSKLRHFFIERGFDIEGK